LARRIPELDGLRGIAILLVMIFHLTPVTIPLFAAYFVQAGWIGVDLFFVLSGYLITGILLDSAGTRGYYRNFILRRTLRIFPLYYASLALFSWREILYAHSWWYAAYLGNFPVWLQNKWPAGVLSPLWSLQVEEQYYLTFPLLVALVSRKTLTRVLIGAVIAAPLLRIAMVLAAPSNIAGTYVLMPCRMDTLALGGLIAIAQRESAFQLRARWIAWVTALAGAAVVFICWKYTPVPWTTQMRTVGFSANAFLFAGLLVLMIHQKRRFLLALCRTRALVFVGAISYGIYLLHAALARYIRDFLKSGGHIGGGWIEAFLCLAATIPAAWISWRFFESPIMRLRNRFTFTTPGEP
jgi:peptidoglycan/LPS O-acetylase OafA/YrhL